MCLVFMTGAFEGQKRAAPGRRRQPDLCEFKGSLVYSTSSRTTRAIQRNLVLEEKKKPKPHEINSKMYLGTDLLRTNFAKTSTGHTFLQVPLLPPETG